MVLHGTFVCVWSSTAWDIHLTYSIEVAVYTFPSHRGISPTFKVLLN